MIELKNLKKHYAAAADNALKGISLSIEKDEFFGLIGPNGSGKTTMVSIICGLLAATSGEVILDGKPVKGGAKFIGQSVSLVPQEIALYPSLSLRENLTFFAKLYQQTQSIEKLAQQVGLKKQLDVAIGSYSSGMQRRANLALGLLKQPRILILDEPTVNVDPQSRLLIHDILRDINKRGCTIIYTTHDLDEVQRICSKIAVIDSGELMAEGEITSLLAHYQVASLTDLFFKLTGEALRD